MRFLIPFLTNREKIWIQGHFFFFLIKAYHKVVSTKCNNAKMIIVLFFIKIHNISILALTTL